MRNSLLVTVVLLLSATWVAARSMPTPDENAPGKAGAKTLRGCLTEASGSYTLTDSAGNQWTLAGNDLSQYAGQEVSVRGWQNQPTVTSEASGAKTTNQSTGELPNFHVNKITKVSGSCPNK
jgi:Protein of unknown function (DUF5818)